MAASKAVSRAPRWRGCAVSSASAWPTAWSAAPCRKASWASASKGSTRDGRAERASSKASRAEFEPAQRLGHGSTRQTGARLVGRQRDGRVGGLARRLGQPQLGQGGREPEACRQVARGHGQRLLEQRPGGRILAAPGRQLARGDARLGAGRPGADQRPVDGDGFGAVGGGLVGTSQQQVVVEHAGKALDQLLGQPPSLRLIALGQSHADLGHPRLGAGRLALGEFGRDRLRLGEAMLGGERLGQPQEHIEVGGMGQQCCLPAAHRLDRVAGILGDAGILGRGPVVLGCRRHEAAAQAVGRGMAPLAAQGADHAEPGVDMGRGEAGHPLPVAQGKIGAPLLLGQPCACDPQVQRRVAAVDRLGQGSVGRLRRMGARKRAGDRHHEPRRQRAAGQRGTGGGSGGGGTALGQMELGQRRLRLRVGHPGQRQQDPLGLVAAALRQEALGQPQAWRQGGGTHSITTCRTPHRRMVSSSVVTK